MLLPCQWSMMLVVIGIGSDACVILLWIEFASQDYNIGVGNYSKIDNIIVNQLDVYCIV